MKTDNFTFHDYYNIDDLLSDEHIMIRKATRDWVKKEVSPTIESICQSAKFDLK